MVAMNLLSNCMDPKKTKTVVEYSSGSTVISMSVIGSLALCRLSDIDCPARIFHGIDGSRAYFSNKAGDVKLKLMQFFGLNMYISSPSLYHVDD
jgi:hypothetical protein